MAFVVPGSAIATQNAHSDSPRGSGTLRVGEESDANQCSSYQGERVYGDISTNQAEFAEILAFRANARGNTEALCSFTSPSLSLPGGMVDDASGKLWVMDSQTATLLAFAHAADGAVQPIQSIAGSQTKLRGLSAAGYQNIAVDKAGNVWVPNQYGYLVAFANDANGNVSPVVSIGLADNGRREHVAGATGLAFDSLGNLYVAVYAPYTVAVFSPPFKDRSKPVALWTTSPSEGASSIFATVDNKNNLFVGGDLFIEEYRGGLKSRGVVWRQYVPHRTGFYDAAADEQGRLFTAMISGGSGNPPNAIGVLPRRSKSFDEAHFITSPQLDNPPNSVAVGL